MGKFYDKLTQLESYEFKRAILSFAIFDLIHLGCAIPSLIVAYSYNPIDALMAAECLVEIVLSLILIAFIAVLVEHNDHGIPFGYAYGFAWLVASSSLFIPLSFSLPEVLSGDWIGSEGISLSLISVSMGLSLLMLLTAAVALLRCKNPRSWRIWTSISLGLCFPLVITTFAGEFFVGREQPLTILFCIRDLAPLAPAILGFSFLWKKESKQ